MTVEHLLLLRSTLRSFLTHKTQIVEEHETNQTVAAAVGQTHFYRRPPAGPSEGNSLIENGQQAGRILVFG